MKVKYNRVSSLSQNGNRYAVAFRDRPMGKELVKLIEAGEIKELVIEEFSRIGRSMGDVIKTMEWLEEMNINVTVRNLGIQSRPNGWKNPIWKMMSAVLASMYELELENIKERTQVGRQIYLQKGGKLGRPKGSNKSETEFLNKPKSQSVIKSLIKGLTIREVSKVVEVSPSFVMNVKKIGEKHCILDPE